MTNTIWTGACGSIIVGAVVGAMAQAPAAPQKATPSAEQKITVTGCLKAAPSAGSSAAATSGAPGTATAGTTGTTGAAAPTDADAKFVLADASVSPAKADTGSAPGAPAAAGTSSAAATQTYQLVANGAALAPHVGKKLELTGTVVDRAASTSTASTPAAAAGPSLQVESGKVIAASCQE
ncbi:MAG TPA: hypothetical protein VH417_11640 [Vicinamibacterales bacterium]|jgi:hypothetical protein